MHIINQEYSSDFTGGHTDAPASRIPDSRAVALSSDTTDAACSILIRYWRIPVQRPRDDLMRTVAKEGLSMNELSNLKPVIRLSIGTEAEPLAFGQGVAALCRGVRESGSLNKAAKSMGMAYSKAWRIMKSAETNLGFDLLFRAGAHGSTLTREGENLLAAYDGLLEQTRDFARKALEETVRD